MLREDQERDALLEEAVSEEIPPFRGKVAYFLGWPLREKERTPEQNAMLDKIIAEGMEKYQHPPRVVLSGMLLDANNWFMSAADDPKDFDIPKDEPPDEPFIISGD